MPTFPASLTHAQTLPLAVILAVVKVIYAIAYMKKPKKNSGLERNLNPRPRDTGAMLQRTEL